MEIHFTQLINNRLFHEADQRIALRAKAKNDLLEEQLRTCSFHPKVKKTGKHPEKYVHARGTSRATLAWNDLRGKVASKC